MNRIEINYELCKGCGLCASFCPHKLIAFGTISNKAGYIMPEQTRVEACTACGLCALMCPDSAIDVYKS